MCSSAGGGLRLAVVGYEREVTAEAGHRVGLSAGAKVVHVASGPMNGSDLAACDGPPRPGAARRRHRRRQRRRLLHNAERLAREPVAAPSSSPATPRRPPRCPRCWRHGPPVRRRGQRAAPHRGRGPGGGPRRDPRGLPRARHRWQGPVPGPRLRRPRRAPTPDAVLRGVEVLAEVVGGDVLVVDVGGATTDVYSVITPQGEEATIHREVVGTLWHARTVKADLGMRWNAEGVVEAARRERRHSTLAAAGYAGRVASDTGHLATSDAEWQAEEWLAETAAVVAVRRHGRPRPPVRAAATARARSPSSSGRVACCATPPDVGPRVLAEWATAGRGGGARCRTPRGGSTRHTSSSRSAARRRVPPAGPGSQRRPRGCPPMRWSGEHRLAVGGRVRARGHLPGSATMGPPRARRRCPGGAMEQWRRGGGPCPRLRRRHQPARDTSPGSSTFPGHGGSAARVPVGRSSPRPCPTGRRSSCRRGVHEPDLPLPGPGRSRHPVVEAPLAEIAEHVDGSTGLVALAPCSPPTSAPLDEVEAACARHGVDVVDVTQATGWRESTPAASRTPSVPPTSGCCLLAERRSHRRADRWDSLVPRRPAGTPGSRGPRSTGCAAARRGRPPLRRVAGVARLGRHGGVARPPGRVGGRLLAARPGARGGVRGRRARGPPVGRSGAGCRRGRPGILAGHGVVASERAGRLRCPSTSTTPRRRRRRSGGCCGTWTCEEGRK